MKTLIYHHPIFDKHDTGPGHPERPERILAVESALRAEQFAELDWREAPLASREQIALIHPTSFIDQIQAAIPEQGRSSLDADTIVSPASWEAALRAAGSACAAVDAILEESGTAKNAFCAVRPPGHHAEPERTMGFCLFNTIAIAAAYAHNQAAIDKVAIIDFDVHHGNGTQAAFWTSADFLFVCSHQSPLYPGTGSKDERGVGNIVNVPLAPYSGSAEIRQAWQAEMAPAINDFKPDMIFISAGFDAHTDDPLASLNFTEADYGWLTEQIVNIAETHCGGRIVASLEGGYDLQALAASVTAHVAALQAAN